MPALDTSILGIFIFGLVAGICPCNSVLCLGLIGYLSSGKTKLSPATIFLLVLAFSAGTILVLLPLGVIAGLIGSYLLFLDTTVAWSFGGILMIAMGVQLLHLYKPPIRKIFSLLKAPVSYTVTGTFLLGLSFGAITIGRGAPMLIIVLTYIALYQTGMQGFFTMVLYGIGLSIPLIVISTIGGAFGQKIKSASRLSGEFFDRIIGIIIIIIGIYFIYLAFR
ncbi:MAG: cytochrome c biogenesis protein CcdA [Methanomicrobiales archaeon]